MEDRDVKCLSLITPISVIFMQTGTYVQRAGSHLKLSYFFSKNVTQYRVRPVNSTRADTNGRRSLPFCFTRQQRLRLWYEGDGKNFLFVSLQVRAQCKGFGADTRNYV